MSDAPDLQQAIHAAKLLRAVVSDRQRISRNYGAGELERDQAMTAGADALEQLQAAQAENQQLQNAVDEARGTARYLHDILFELRPIPTPMPAWMYKRAGYDTPEQHAALGQVDQ